MTTTTSESHPHHHSASATSSTNYTTTRNQHHVILFYKYHPLTNDYIIMERYRIILQSLCQSLTLQGRILIGCSKTSEGINGTLSSINHTGVLFFTYALLHDTLSLQQYNASNSDIGSDTSPTKDEVILMYKAAVESYWKQSKEFFQLINEAELIMESSDDFKWSVSKTTTTTNTASHDSNGIDDEGNRDYMLFPDMNVKLVKELIGTGGLFSSIQHNAISQGYLTPQEWHEHLLPLMNQSKLDGNQNASGNVHNDSIIIDCRNIKEYDIGHFPNAINPNTTTFAQFPRWAENHQPILSTKKNIYMYCTGGIRCEKASAYIRKLLINTDHVNVYHLKGGIHKYLEAYGSNSSGRFTTKASSGHDVNVSSSASTSTSLGETSLWYGKNFVFDSRVSADANTHGFPVKAKRDEHQHNNGNHLNANEMDATGKHDNSIDLDQSQKPTMNHKGEESIQSINGNDTTGSNHCTDGNDSNIVGRCLYCNIPYDRFDANCVCTVCREPVLVCFKCRNNIDSKEYHCINHYHLKTCYFTNLEAIAKTELEKQLHELIYIHLQPISIGRKFKQKRKTLQKQIIRIQNQLQKLNDNNGIDRIVDNNNDDSSMKQQVVVSNVSRNDLKNYHHSTSEPSEQRHEKLKCRSCADVNCTGRCWGFFGLKRKELLLSQKENNKQRKNSAIHRQGRPYLTTSLSEKNKNIQITTIEQQIDMSVLLSSQHRDVDSGIRVMPPTTRFLRCNAKANWCGRSVLSVIQNEFHELKNPNQLKLVIDNGLLLLNDKPIESMMEVANIQLKSSDQLGRFIHWHEAPVHVPERIQYTKTYIPIDILIPYAKGIERDELVDHCYVYVCNKPATVPVHPAGPYYLNSLIPMILAQIMEEEGMKHSMNSLKAIHRTDRPTSGLTLCCTSSVVARFFHRFLVGNKIEKLYLAEVNGKFPSCFEESQHDTIQQRLHGSGSYRWDEVTQSIQVDAPIYTLDISNGIRIVDQRGKPSQSYFQFVKYNAITNKSFVACYPITGRNHQLRVHLQWLGYPIINDVMYGSPPETSLNMKDRSILLMERSMSYNNHSQQDTTAARKACLCCNGLMPSTREAIKSCFTSSQLLEFGHAIHLHASRYRLKLANEPDNRFTFTRKRKKDQTVEVNEDRKQPQIEYANEKSSRTQSTTYDIEFEVDNPRWYEPTETKILIF